ncbi:MAG TPA: MgtC/SapB family protein [Terriglobales bacterium]|nr:MgtC/SapB family protein [Terriglobales bacterium]
MEPIHEIVRRLGGEMSVVLSSTLVRLFVAAILGGVIGLEREFRRKPAGLRTNMFICFGAAMFTVLSDTLAAEHIGDHTRIAAQIIPGIGFIGAGSILHARGSVTGLTTAATLFVVASVGMAAGGGLYLTAIFATVLILMALLVLGRLERSFSLKSLVMSYEVTGASAETVIAELNRILDAEKQTLQNVRTAKVDGLSRVVFSVDAPRNEHEELSILLHQSSVFSTVASLGTAELE